MTKHLVEPEELQAYLDRELAPARQREVGNHVDQCAQCSRLLGELKRVSATLQRWQVEPAPPTLRPPVIVEAKPHRRWLWGRLALGLSGAVAVVLIVAAVSIPNLLRSRMAGPSPKRSGEELAPLYGPNKDSRNAQGFGAGGNVTAGPATDEQAFRIMRKVEPESRGRLIAYQVKVTVEVKELERAKGKLRNILDAEGGYVTNSDFIENPNQPRQANLVIRVPAVKLATILNQVRELGRVKEEHLNSEEVTEQVVDLEARLRNARATEQRLIEILKNRTGKVGEVLNVEREIARTREEIERMDAQRQNLLQRVELATIQVALAEEFKAELMPAPVGTLTRLRNALVDGYDNFLASFLGLVVFVARYGLTLIFWGGLVWLTWRRVRRSLLRFTRSI